MNDRKLALLLSLLLLALVSPLRADQVLLDDDSRIVGQINRLGPDGLVIETNFAGTLTIPAKKVASIRTDGPVTVALEGGDRATGRLQVVDGRQQITGTAFGDVTVDRAKIVGLWTPGESSPEVIAREQALQRELAQTRAEHQAEIAATREAHQAQAAEYQQTLENYRDPWSGRFELGLSGDTGNNERMAFRGAAEARREVENERLTIYGSGNYARENGERTENEILGGARLERDISDRWFAYGRGELEFDEFENLDLRSVVGAGVGYFFIREDDHELRGRAGVGYMHESFDNGVSTDQGIVDLGYDYRIDLNDWLRFTHSLTYLPTFDEPTSDYRLVAETAGEVPLSKDKAWKLRAGMRNEYDAMPTPGVERLDTSYFLNLVYDWD
jgi:putative salt-induced outer membrane protein YdiY